MHEAARTNANPEIVTALIEAGADVDGRVTDAAFDPLPDGRFRCHTCGAARRPLWCRDEGATPASHGGAMTRSGNRYPAVIENARLVRGGGGPGVARPVRPNRSVHGGDAKVPAVFPVLLRLGVDAVAVHRREAGEAGSGRCRPPAVKTSLACPPKRSIASKWRTSGCCDVPLLRRATAATCQDTDSGTPAHRATEWCR